MLEFKNITGTDKKFNLKDISFCAPKGYITGLTGVNGAGKTTLFHYIFDDKVRYSGEILYDGKNIRTDFASFKNIMAFISDEKRFFQNLSIKGNVRMIAPFYDNWDNKMFLKYIKQMDVPIDKRLSELSRGQYIKFQLAFSISHGAKLYLLDEATAGMDPVFRRDFYNLLHELMINEDITILMSSHIDEEICIHMDYIGILEDGTLVEFKEVEGI